MSGDNEDHIEKLKTDESHQDGEGNGCVTRCIWERQGGKFVCKKAGHDHKENGFNYQLANEADWYNLDFYNPGEARQRFEQIFNTPIKAAYRDPTKVDKVWYMGAGPYSHLNFKGSDWWPWANNAHHIIPVDDVLTSLLKFDELQLLQQAKYNVHKGVNIIYLPKSERRSRLYQLPRHPKYHSTYSRDVRLAVDRVKLKLTKAKDSEDKKNHKAVTKETAPDLANHLHQFSKRTRADLREFGLSSPGSHINQLFEWMNSR
ncbi:AHH domain-containing protein [Myxococcus sp. AM009]|uniref:AHH domain-containing protein n=1 Tax=unclassified Myxococcus TaxID=2648731 RepID=UPI001595B554|nr:MULTISPECIES: AHH domain-containing protein [unclassified Myxococcus]NVI96618.1 AHH domain-containing protein [Myxococcus sp. AM009]NVJ12655.1 AHH domain-containing protein [Myxococcus sp. AM010]